jgi:hypothetical protein
LVELGNIKNERVKKSVRFQRSVPFMQQFDR